MKLYIPLFRSCTTIRTLLQLHAHLLVTGLHRDALAATKLLESYAKMDSVNTSRLVFDNFSNPDSFMWAVMIKSYVWTLCFKEAISLYHDMHQQQLGLSSYVFSSVLKACSGLSDTAMARKIHGTVIKTGFESDAAVETSLLLMYGESGSLDDALQVFDVMLMRDVVAWSSMISICVKVGKPEIGLMMFCQMDSGNVELDNVLILKVIEACGELGSQGHLRSVHGHYIRKWPASDELIENSFVSIYGKCDDLCSAEKLFTKASRRSIVSWTAMISCYNHTSCYKEALHVFTEMLKSDVEPNALTLVAVLLSCTQLGFIREGKSLHAFFLRTGIDDHMSSTSSALINMYASFRKLGHCYDVFKSIQEKTQVSWNSLIAGYTKAGFLEKALTLFAQMRKEGLFPDSFTLSSCLPACGLASDFDLGTQFHAFVFKAGLELNEFVQNSLIDMYCKCGCTGIAYRVFDAIEKKGIVTWNAMISGFSRNGGSREAIALFDTMQSQGFEFDSVTFLSVIQACCHLGSLAKGNRIHQKLIASGLKKEMSTDTSLINMYAKCGDINMARKVFDHMAEKNVVSWTSIISGYGTNGLVDQAISLFDQMAAPESGVRPNEATFMSILSACSHAGLIEKGMQYLNLMKEFSIAPQVEHCACLVDLLSRAGHVDQAYSFIESVTASVELDATIWRALLNGCQVHHREDLASAIQTRILQIQY